MMKKPAIAKSTTIPPAAIPTFSPRSSPPFEAPVVPLRILSSGSVMLTFVLEKTVPSIDMVLPAAGSCSQAAPRAIASGEC